MHLAYGDAPQLLQQVRILVQLVDCLDDVDVPRAGFGVQRDMALGPCALAAAAGRVQHPGTALLEGMLVEAGSRTDLLQVGEPLQRPVLRQHGIQVGGYRGAVGEW